MERGPRARAQDRVKIRVDAIPKAEMLHSRAAGGRKPVEGRARDKAKAPAAIRAIVEERDGVAAAGTNESTRQLFL